MSREIGGVEPEIFWRTVDLSPYKLYMDGAWLTTISTACTTTQVHGVKQD